MSYDAELIVPTVKTRTKLLLRALLPLARRLLSPFDVERYSLGACIIRVRPKHLSDKLTLNKGAPKQQPTNRLLPDQAIKEQTQQRLFLVNIIQTSYLLPQFSRELYLCLQILRL